MIFHSIQYNSDILLKSSNGAGTKFNNLSEKIDETLNTNKAIRGYVLESVIDQHPLMQEIYPHSVNTLRIITNLTKDGQPKIIGTRLRMGRNGNLVDNIFQGGGSMGQ